MTDQRPAHPRHDDPTGTTADLRAGQAAVVRVAVATLWSSPEAVRPVDTAALAPRVDTAAWLAAMDTTQRVGDCVLSQLLLGEPVLVTEVRRDGWTRVVAVEQPAAGLDPRGYPGWVPGGQLATVPAHDATPATDPLVVDTPVTALHTAPHGDVTVPGVVLGTRLHPAGPARDGWRPTRPAGHRRPLWLPDRDLVPLPSSRPTAHEVLPVAQRFLGVSYVWGGMSPYGIDCSGLVHLVWRRFGVVLPRDAYAQAEATAPLAFGTEGVGDLYFFARPGRRIHHVGMVCARPGSDGERRMLHACYRQRRVVEEPLSAERTATLVAVHRVPSASVTAPR